MNYWVQNPDTHIYVAAHRGWSEKYPENTLEAFRAALALGVDQIETDIRVTKDGQLVLIHDALADRTTDGTGPVREMTLAEVKALDAGCKKGKEYAGARIPTLEEFLDLIKDEKTLTVDFELKEYPDPGDEDRAYEVCDKALAMITEAGWQDRCVVNTFSAKLSDYVREKYGSRFRRHVYSPLRYMCNMTEDPWKDAYCCCMFGDNWGMAAPEEFAAMWARGIQPWAGASVKDEASVQAAIDRRAWLITCNNPDRVLALLRQKGRHP